MRIILLLEAWLGALVGMWISYSHTYFIPPKGLWKLVPFRVSGWRSHTNPDKIYPLKWIWEDIDFSI